MNGAEDGNGHVVPCVLQCETEDEDGDGHEGGGEPYDQETGFGSYDASVAFHVEFSDEVVQPVADGGAEEGTDYRGEVEHACCFGKISAYCKDGICRPGERRCRRTEVVGGEFVDGGQPNGNGGVDTDDPGKVQEIVYRAQEDRKFRYRNDGTHDCLPERLPSPTRSPLLDANEPKEAGFRHWLTFARDVAVVDGFIHETDDEKPA